MMEILFNVIKILLLISALMVVISKNPVHSVLFLVLVFVNASAILFMFDAEFIATVLIVVYVGAIAVLFLFVCMMLNVRFEDQTTKLVSYVPISGIIGIVLSFQLSVLVYSSYMEFLLTYDYVEWISVLDNTQNIVTLGQLLYTVYFHYFLLAAYILLVGMLGAIVLTLHHRRDVRRQVIYTQLQRQYQETIKISHE